VEDHLVLLSAVSVSKHICCSEVISRHAKRAGHHIVGPVGQTCDARFLFKIAGLECPFRNAKQMREVPVASSIGNKDMITTDGFDVEKKHALVGFSVDLLHFMFVPVTFDVRS
jgi:hypothetical protein